MKLLLRALVVILPWPVRRWVLMRGWGYRIAPTARIGWSWIFPDMLVMEEHARIGHFNVAIHLRELRLGAYALIERGNWITGFPAGGSRHFQHLAARAPDLMIGQHAAVTKNHHIDCTDRVEIGEFSIVAGYGSQLLTHAIDVEHNRQSAAPIAIGKHCLVGTAVVILGGGSLPDRSVLGAKALLNAAHTQPGWLYAGVPAKPIRAYPPEAAFFNRQVGFVD